VTRVEWEEVEEEPVGDEYEEAGEEYEPVPEDHEPVEDAEEEVARPPGDPVLEYVHGLAGPGRIPQSWSWLALASEAVRYSNMAKLARERGMREDAARYSGYAARYARLAFDACPRRREGGCPLTDVLALQCPVGLERRCRALARRTPKRW